LNSWAGLDEDESGSVGCRSFEIKNTFLNFDLRGLRDAEDDSDFGAPTRSISLPQILRDQDRNTSPRSVAVEWAESLPSVGASLHASGQCKPCAWFWKPEGCRWGAECCHCHLCPEGELRRRKKSRQAELKEIKASQKAT
jgi:hypothetical protein